MDNTTPFPSLNVRIMLLLYRLIWLVCLPLVIAYLFLRGWRDPIYVKYLGERFGIHKQRMKPHIWIHAVSLGELRSAAPLIEELLKSDTPIVTTHFTPAGRRESERLFTTAISDGRLTACYIPFDYGAALRRFFKAFRPKYGLLMEFEAWPGIIMNSRKKQIPLFICNGAYSNHSIQRDQKRYFSPAKTLPGLSGAMVKSEFQADQFRQLGVDKVAVTGEMRFEQRIPTPQVAAATAIRKEALSSRTVITLSSIVVGEDTDALQLIETVQTHFTQQGLAKPLFIYVPRAPERFGLISDMIAAKPFIYGMRSNLLTEDLKMICPEKIKDLDILLGNSLGEMYFYLSLCDLAIIGGGFCKKGSHNISEALCLGKPVMIGPTDYGIEFPAREAIEYGVCKKMDFEQITQFLLNNPAQFCASDQVDAFVASHSGSTDKTMAAIKLFLDP